MPDGMNDLLKLSQAELDALFAASPPGPIPNGDAKGLAIIEPGSEHAPALADIARRLWQGKTFDAQHKTLRNQVGLFGVKAIAADVCEGKSLFDDKDCIVLDYSERSVIAGPVRDEIRLIAPDTYLGRIYWDGKYAGYFALHMQDMAAEQWRRRFRALLALVIGIPLLIAIPLLLRFLPTRPVTYADPNEHFKYGSTGGFISAGIPYWVWRAMPVVFKDRLPKYYPYTPGREYGAFGLVYEPGHDVPIGIQKGRNMGIDRVFLNCSACHHSTVRETRNGEAKIYLGMPAARFDIGAFQRFLFDTVKDERFDAEHFIPEIERQAGRLSLLDRYIVYPLAIGLMRPQLIRLGNRLERTHPETFGPGRNDTFNPEKGVWGFPMKDLPDSEFDAKSDFPSIWNQRKKLGMQLHWDGNNGDVTERNKNAAFASGTIPSTVDLASLERIVKWNWDLKPPAYPEVFPINQALAAQGAPIYKQWCADCHGKDGQDFSGEYVGKVTPIEEIDTDRHRLDSFTYELATNLAMPYAGEPYKFKHFRKTYGYANLPLDGLWLRAPYLHNGSVPTLRDLLRPPCPEPPKQCPAGSRPEMFYRGSDLYDPINVGFVSTEPTEGQRTYFPFNTNEKGNSNRGHLYGTRLSENEKDAMLEYLKTF